MHRFFLPPELAHGETLTLDGPEAHHALRVLRLREGDEATVLNGAGGEFQCIVTETGKRHLTLRKVGIHQHPRPGHTITLIQSISKTKSMDVVIQKATELGAARIVPLLTEHTDIKLTSEDALRKAEHWRADVIEAVKQSGQPWMPQVDVPQTLAAYLNRRESFGLSLVASLQPGTRIPREVVREYLSHQPASPITFAVWVGPEGDFSPAEIQTIISNGATPITLGSLILRVETAAIYCLSILRHELLGTPWA